VPWRLVSIILLLVVVCGGNMIPERLPVSGYMKCFVRQIDGITWVLVSIASLLLLLDVMAGTEFVPIRERTDFGKAIVLLIFTPLISFLVVTFLRQFPFSSGIFSAWMRAAACLGTLLILNF
jgi:hypothetical protein